MEIKPHDFKVGDKIQVFNPWTAWSIIVYSKDYYIIGIDGDYFICRENDFRGRVERIPTRYKHMRKR